MKGIQINSSFSSLTERKKVKRNLIQSQNVWDSQNWCVLIYKYTYIFCSDTMTIQNNTNIFIYTKMLQKTHNNRNPNRIQYKSFRCSYQEIHSYIRADGCHLIVSLNNTLKMYIFILLYFIKKKFPIVLSFQYKNIIIVIIWKLSIFITI